MAVEELLILHADLPLVTAEALRDLIAQAPEAPSATLVRPGDGGTNAMLLRPPGRFPLAYGRGSGDLHESAAREAGLAVRRADAPALALDLDTPSDVRALLSTAEGRGDGGGALPGRESASRDGRRSGRVEGQAQLRDAAEGRALFGDRARRRERSGSVPELDDVEAVDRIRRPEAHREAVADGDGRALRAPVLGRGRSRPGAGPRRGAPSRGPSRTAGTRGRRRGSRPRSRGARPRGGRRRPRPGRGRGHVAHGLGGLDRLAFVAGDNGEGRGEVWQRTSQADGCLTAFGCQGPLAGGGWRGPRRAGHGGPREGVGGSWCFHRIEGEPCRHLKAGRSP